MGGLLLPLSRPAGANAAACSPPGVGNSSPLLSSSLQSHTSLCRRCAALAAAPAVLPGCLLVMECPTAAGPAGELPCCCCCCCSAWCGKQRTASAGESPGVQAAPPLLLQLIGCNGSTSTGTLGLGMGSSRGDSGPGDTCVLLCAAPGALLAAARGWGCPAAEGLLTCSSPRFSLAGSRT